MCHWERRAYKANDTPEVATEGGTLLKIIPKSFYYRPNSITIESVGSCRSWPASLAYIYTLQ